MTSFYTVGTIVLKIVKLLINSIILILYRIGNNGQFLGIGGTWNLNESKNPDMEIIASGVLVGFFIYTGAILCSYCYGATSQRKSLSEIIMNLVGMILFIAVGAMAIHYWYGYIKENRYSDYSSARQCGIALGLLCLLEGAIYLIDLVLIFMNLVKGEWEYME